MNAKFHWHYISVWSKVVFFFFVFGIVTMSLLNVNVIKYFGSRCINYRSLFLF